MWVCEWHNRVENCRAKVESTVQCQSNLLAVLPRDEGPRRERGQQPHLQKRARKVHRHQGRVGSQNQCDLHIESRGTIETIIASFYVKVHVKPESVILTPYLTLNSIPNRPIKQTCQVGGLAL